MTDRSINIWLYVILSLIPFVGYYPFLKLKKARLIIIINIPITVSCVLVTLLVNQTFGQFLTYLLVPIIDGCFVYDWALKYNESLKT